MGSKVESLLDFAPSVGVGLMSHILCGYAMSDWKSLIDQAMIQEGSNIIGAHATYGKAVQAALQDTQKELHDLEAAKVVESIYGALVAYSQVVMTCLLYTSPSPRDATLSRMPSSA